MFVFKGPCEVQIILSFVFMSRCLAIFRMSAMCYHDGRQLYRTVAEISLFKFGLANILDVACIFDEGYKHQ